MTSYPSRAPLHIDNRGTYVLCHIPDSFVLPKDSSGGLLPPKVEGRLPNGAWVVLEEYDDFLPAPARVGFDDSRKSFRLDTPVLFELEGTGAPLQAPNPIRGLPLPNRLSFWLDNLGDFIPVVRIGIKGEAYPSAVWDSQRQEQSETIILTDEGYGESDTIWDSIDSIQVFGLPEGARLRGYAIRFGLPPVRTWYAMGPFGLGLSPSTGLRHLSIPLPPGLSPRGPEALRMRLEAELEGWRREGRKGPIGREGLEGSKMRTGGMALRTGCVAGSVRVRTGVRNGG